MVTKEQGWRPPPRRRERCQDPIMAVEDLEMPIGDYAGQTLGQIADADVLYLTRVIERTWFRRKHANFTEAIKQILRKRAAQVEEMLE